MSFFGGFKKLVKPVLIAAAVAAVVATAGGAAPILLAGGSFAAAASAVSISSVLAAAAVAGFTTAAGILLGPKPKSVGFAATAAVRQAAFNLPIVYGRARVGGGMILYRRGDADDDDLIVAVAVACHKINKIRKIYAGDVLLYDADDGGAQFNAGKLEVDIRLGADGQSSSPIVDINLDLENAWALHGVAYYVIRFRNYAKSWSSGVGGFWAEIEGCADVYNPATGNRIYTNNWALCVGDYLTRKRGGGRLEYDTDVDLASLQQAAAICNQPVTEDGGTQKRYTINGVIDTGIRPMAVVKDMAAYGVGQIIQAGGKFHIVAGEEITPVGTIVKNDLASPLTIDSSVEFENYPDGARGLYTRADGRYQSDSYPLVKLSDAPEQPTILNVDLPMCLEPHRAQRLASAAVRQGRRSRTIVTGLFSEFLGAVAGTIYNFDFDDFGIDGPFEIISSSIEITAEGAQIRVTMLEYSLTLFDVGDVTQPPTFVDSSLPSPLIVADPTGVLAVAQTVILGDGTTQSEILVTWNEVDSLYDLRYDIRWKPVSGAYRSRRTDSTSYLIQGEPRGVALTVEVRAVNLYGGKSNWVDAGTVTPSNDVTPPPVPEVTIGPVSGGFVFNVSHSYVYPSDFSHFRLYEGDDQAAFGATSYEMSAGGRQSQFRRDGLAPDTSKSYYVTAVDQTGNESAPSARKDGTTPTLLTQAEIDQAISTVVATANNAEQAAQAAQDDADQAIADALTNAGNIEQTADLISVSSNANLLRNSGLTVGSDNEVLPEYWFSFENPPDHGKGVRFVGSGYGGGEGAQPMYMHRVANAPTTGAHIYNMHMPRYSDNFDLGTFVNPGVIVEASANVGAYNGLGRILLQFRDSNDNPISTSYSSSTNTYGEGNPKASERLAVSAEAPAGTQRVAVVFQLYDVPVATDSSWLLIYQPMLTQKENLTDPPAPYTPSSAMDAASERAYVKQTRSVLVDDGMALAQDLTQVMARVDTNEGNISAEVSNRQTAISDEQQARALSISQTSASLQQYADSGDASTQNTLINDLRGSTEIAGLSLADLEGVVKSSLMFRSVAGKYQARLGVLADNNGTSTILLDAKDIIATGTITAASALISEAAILSANIKDLAVTRLKIAGKAVNTDKLNENSVTRLYSASGGSVSNANIINVNMTRAGEILVGVSREIVASSSSQWVGCVFRIKVGGNFVASTAVRADHVLGQGTAVEKRFVTIGGKMAVGAGIQTVRIEIDETGPGNGEAGGGDYSAWAVGVFA